MHYVEGNAGRLGIDERANRRGRLLFTAVLAAWITLALYPGIALQFGLIDIPLANDFASFWTGASLVRSGDGAKLYDLQAQAQIQRDIKAEYGIREEIRQEEVFRPYFNPPPLALLLIPFTLFPLPIAYLLWQMVGLTAILIAISIPFRGRPLASLTTAILFSYVGVGITLFEGQVNWLFLIAFSLGLLALASGRPLLGGALLGLLWLKPQYAVVFPLIFLVKGRWRELAAMGGTGAALALLSLIMIGPAGAAQYWELSKQMGNFLQPTDWCVNPEYMVNWRALIVNLWPGIPATTGSTIAMALGAATIAASMLAWRGPWEPTSPRFPRQMLVAAMASIIASPHSHFHGTLLLLAPLALSVTKPMPEAWLSHIWRPMLLLGYFLAWLTWPIIPALWEKVPIHWILVPYMLLNMAVLILQARPQSSIETAARSKEALIVGE